MVNLVQFKIMDKHDKILTSITNWGLKLIESINDICLWLIDLSNILNYWFTQKLKLVGKGKFKISSNKIEITN